VNREDAKQYVSFVVDNALSARDCRASEVLPTDWLIGWQCGFEPLFVAVRSYLSDTQGNPDTIDDAEEAVELAREYLVERNWFSGPSSEPDHVLALVEEAKE
jgi:hypothetical protein